MNGATPHLDRALAEARARKALEELQLLDVRLRVDEYRAGIRRGIPARSEARTDVVAKGAPLRG